MNAFWMGFAITLGLLSLFAMSNVIVLRLKIISELLLQIRDTLRQIRDGRTVNPFTEKP